MLNEFEDLHNLLIILLVKINGCNKFETRRLNLVGQSSIVHTHLLTYFLLLEPIHLPRKNGTTSLLQASTRDAFLLPHVTRLPVLLTLLTVWEIEFSLLLLLTATTLPRPNTGESSSSKLLKLRDSIATPTSTVWTSPEISHAPWSRSGTPLSSLSSKQRPPMATSWECSALLSLRKHIDKLRLHAMPKLPTRSSLERRWWRLCNQLFKSQPSRTSSRSCKYTFFRQWLKILIYNIYIK